MLLPHPHLRQNTGGLFSGNGVKHNLWTRVNQHNWGDEHQTINNENYLLCNVKYRVQRLPVLIIHVVPKCWQLVSFRQSFGRDSLGTSQRTDLRRWHSTTNNHWSWQAISSNSKLLIHPQLLLEPEQTVRIIRYLKRKKASNTKDRSQRKSTNGKM